MLTPQALIEIDKIIKQTFIYTLCLVGQLDNQSGVIVHVHVYMLRTGCTCILFSFFKQFQININPDNPLGFNIHASYVFVTTFFGGGWGFTQSDRRVLSRRHVFKTKHYMCIGVGFQFSFSLFIYPGKYIAYWRFSIPPGGPGDPNIK